MANRIDKFLVGDHFQSVQSSKCSSRVTLWSTQYCHLVMDNSTS